MFEQTVKNRYLARAQSWVMLSLGALTLSTGCTREEDTEFHDQRDRLSIQKVGVASASDWMTRSNDNSDDKPVYVKLGDSLVLYAQVEPLGVDTTEVLTRGTPIMNVNDLSDIRMNLYNSAAANWTASMPVTEAIKVSRSGKVYITSPLYNWSSKTDKVTLLTYTPLPSATNGLVEGANGNTVSYTVPTDITKQPDFCATIADNNIVNSDGMKHMRSVTFYHKLTAIGFALNGWNVKVTKIEVSGVVLNGTFNLGSSVWTPGVVSSDSRLLGVNTSKVPVDYYKDPTVWTDITRSNGYLMMVPQTLTDQAKVQITYTDAAGKEQVIMALLREMSSGSWVAGNKITYCIQLETAPSIGTDPISLYMPWKAGYTTSTQVPFVVSDPQDRYTFNWGEEWNIIHRGPAKVNNLSGGAASGWYTASTNTTPIWFFTKESNPSISSSRSSVVTLDAWRTVDRTFTVVQGMKPYISVEGMPLTNDLIPKDGKTATVTVKSNYPWESVLRNVTLNPSSGGANMSGQRVVVTILEGDGTEGAISTIFKTTNDNKVPDLVASTSYNFTRAIILKVTPPTPGELVPGDGKSYTAEVRVASTATWTATPNTGVTVTPTSGKGVMKVTITVASNPSEVNQRNVQVVFKEGKDEAVWSGKQDMYLPYVIINKVKWMKSNLTGTPSSNSGHAFESSPEGYGMFFKWASTYVYGRFSSANEGAGFRDNEYTRGSSTVPTGRDEGYVYNKVALNGPHPGDPCQKVGKRYRTPTATQRMSLVNSDRTRGSYRGIIGVFCGPNAKSCTNTMIQPGCIFIPFAGRRRHDTGEYDSVGVYAEFWLSSMIRHSLGCTFVPASVSSFLQDDQRSYGYSVRCVIVD